ncbi:MAG: deoxyribodipyrimidine photo-lyase, partial [Planctomycetales bacterium]|nr:deoxyribodipyrimidine photo-lyase [Planctomycetales bacterium]
MLTLAGTAFKVFTPFWRAASGRGDPDRPLAAPPRFTTTLSRLDTPQIPSLRLLPASPDWAGGLREAWVPGENGALDRLEAACRLAAKYAEHRDRPDIDGTSRLSPHLHFGEVSPRQVWWDLMMANS